MTKNIGRMDKYQIQISNNKTNQSKLLHWELDCDVNYNEEIVDYIKRMIDFQTDDPFWKDMKFEDYSWMVTTY